MQRTSVVAEIFGYLVCLLMVVVFFASVAGVVSGAFRVAHPTPQPPMAAQHFVAGPAEGFPGGPMMKPPPEPFVSGRLIANERYDATRRFVVAVVLLILSILVFNRAFGWLNSKQGPTT
jgi:hypothetical protein